MAHRITIGGHGDLFIGEDKTLELEILDADHVPIDVADWAVVFDVRTHDSAALPILQKPATIVGTFDPARATNTQRARVTLTDTDTGALALQLYRHSWKRTDEASETVLAYGTLIPERATQA